MPKTFLNKSPIAVYQMGKVGSETIFNSLIKLNLDVPIYHVHVLYQKNIDRAINNYQKQNQPLTFQLKQSKILRDYLDRENNPALNVITGVREPVAQFISAFFQNIESSNPNFIDRNGDWKEKEIAEHLTKQLTNYDINNAWNCNWFDNDFKPALGVDVYQYKFDKELGYVEFSYQNIRVLILQLESSDLWSEQLESFFQLSEPIKIIKRNLSYDKKYNHVYKKILENFCLPATVLEKIYQSKYCSHFYTQEDIRQFLNRWSSKKKQI